MQRIHRNLGVAAVVSLVALGGPGVMAMASPSASSTAEIGVTDCVVESSKDISHVAYLADGETLHKDEDVDAESFDLSQVAGIEDVDTVSVKAGTTVEEFAVACAAPVEEQAEDGDDAPESDDEGRDRAATAGSAGHGEGDVRHEGRHEKWGGDSSEEAGGDDERAAATFHSRDDEPEREHEGEGRDRAATAGSAGHGEGDVRHEGRHEKWGGDSSEEADGDDERAAATFHSRDDEPEYDDEGEGREHEEEYDEERDDHDDHEGERDDDDEREYDDDERDS